MTQEPPKQHARKPSIHKPPEDFRSLSIRILHYANRGVSLIPFLRQLTKIILEFSGCDAVELRISDSGILYHARATRRPEKNFHFNIIDPAGNGSRKKDIAAPILDELCTMVAGGRLDPSTPQVTRNGSLWISDTDKPVALMAADDEDKAESRKLDEIYKSMAMIPFVQEDESVGLLCLMSLEKYYLTENEIELYETIAQTLGLAIADRRARAECHERVKELSCLYGIANLSAARELNIDDLLRETVKLLPPAWQFPEIASARIILDDKTFATGNFCESPWFLSSPVVVNEKIRGSVEVGYCKERPFLHEGPFLREERSLINAVASEIAVVIERREAEEYHERLQEQLRHADRLATLGQLAAGIAHELNEPLVGILGFAQLAQKNPDIPEETDNDLRKIVKAALHAREVVKKLLIFARQMPTRKTAFSLNKLIEDGFYFIESRSAKQKVEIVRELDESIPEIYADSAQLHQVLVNLMVNAIQAMPDGGQLKVETVLDDDHVLIVVEDNGVGMSEEVRKKAFMPFFTTKDVGDGTGLGLSVVHGIITSHGGTIRLSSEEGKGSRFEVRLPLGASDESRTDKENDR